MQNWKPLLRSNWFYVIFVFLLILFVLGSFLIPKRSIYKEGIATVEGKVISYKIDGNFLSFVVEADEKIQAFYYFSTEQEKLSYFTYFGYGVTVRMKGAIESPQSNSLPNTFHYQKYLYYQDIYSIFNVQELEIVKPSSGIYFFKNFIYRCLFNRKYGDYLVAMVLGNTTYLDVQDVRINGISHLFAVSGMQITLLAKVMEILFRKFGTKKDIGILFFLWIYAFLVGFTPSVMRAVLFWCYQFLNRKGRLQLHKTQIFLWVLGSILLVCPFAIMNLGFQYSFLISFVLLHMKFHKNYFIRGIQISVVSFLVSFPITAYHFYYVNVFSILWNLFFVPFVSFVLFPLCFLFLFFPFLEAVLGIGITIFEVVNEWCATVSFGIIVIPKVSIVLWGVYYLLLGCILFMHKKHFCFLLVFLICFIKCSCKLSNHAYVYFLDVGQGDSAVFVAPHQKEVILVDIGGKIVYPEEEWEKRNHFVDPAETIKTFLNSLGISKIDTLVLSHGDVDHAGNALSFLEKMKVSYVLMNRNTKNSLEKNIAYSYPHKIISTLSSSSFQIADFTLKQPMEENDASLVLQFSIYEQTFLMTGDISQKVEEKLLDLSLCSTVLKVAHHGSNTSTKESFLRRVSPSYAVISVGKDNRYGHPSKETIQVLERNNVTTFLTSRDKTIWFEIAPSWMKVFHLD